MLDLVSIIATDNRLKLRNNVDGNGNKVRNNKEIDGSVSQMLQLSFTECLPFKWPVPT